MKKIFGTNKGTLLIYTLISLVVVGLSCISLIFNNQFNYYPIVVTAISFAFGALYLLASLISMNKKIKMSESKGMNIMMMMGGNFLRFSILLISIACSFLFVHFGPREGEIEKWVYLLVLISGLPMFVNIGLFYMRGKYVE